MWRTRQLVICLADCRLRRLIGIVCPSYTEIDTVPKADQACMFFLK